MAEHSESRRVKLVFADRGAFHTETVRIPVDGLPDHERLLDLLREDAAVTRRLHLDLRRLVAAFLEEEGG